MAKRQVESNPLGNTKGNTFQLALQRGLLTVLVLVEELKQSIATAKDREATLSTLKKIFDNIIQHPNDDKYRQIKLANKTFSNKVWRYPVAVNLMKMGGWVEDGDCVRLRNESDAKAISEVLEREFEPTPRPCHESENVTTDSSSTNSSICCALTDVTGCNIGMAIQTGNGQRLKELLSPYHATCVKNMQVAESVSIIGFVCMTRQIGLARILVNEYGVDFNTLNDKGNPDFYLLFDGCDSSESCQSLIIEFIKELKIDVHKPSFMTALHFAMLHKLFTVVKFLVEDCKVDVNCVNDSVANGTPLHVAYGMGEESVAQYLIEHGADQDALDRDGRKPIDYKLYVNSINSYAHFSQYFVKRRVLRKGLFTHENAYFAGLCEQGIADIVAVELTYKEFPSLKEKLDGGIVNEPNLEATPTPKELNHYITDMAPSYQEIGLELDIPYATLKLIRKDPNLSDLKEKCRKMLEVWLENDTSATWKKLCDALQEVGMSVLAEQILLFSRVQAESNRSGNTPEALLLELNDSTPKDREDTLSMLKLIFDNVIQHPNDDKYRQIKLNDEAFVNKVWRCPAAVNVMKMSGWEEDDDCVRLRDESHAEAMSKLLKQALLRISLSTLHSSESALVTNTERPRLHENENNTPDVGGSSECCVFTEDKINSIGSAVHGGHGDVLMKLLRPYHFACLKNVRFAGASITELVCFSRQIGLARILASEYGADFASSNEGELPICFIFFKGCDSTESCQSLIIQFIKEFKIDVHRQYHYTALHFAVLHKLFTIVKFLVEDCKVDVNCANEDVNGGTSLHMAYGLGEESIAQYLIEHGAEQDVLDGNGRKPIDYKLYAYSRNIYARYSQYLIKQRVIHKYFGRDENRYFKRLCNEGYHEEVAVELTFKQFPSLQKNLDGDIANHQNLEATPTLNKLNHYITDMAPSYYKIGLELDILNSQLKVIDSDPSLPDLERKCRKMLELWLESDTSATWKRLCVALQEVGMIVLAEQIKNSL